jgi:hypothetical protein
MSIKITSPLDQVDSAVNPAFEYGTRATDKYGNEFIYLPGTTSVEKYDACRFSTSNGSVVRMAQAAAVNAAVGIAQGAITSNSAGWFQTYGTGWVQCGEGGLTGSAMYAGGTAGTVSGVLVATEPILNMVGIGSGATGANGTIKVRLAYPNLRCVIGIM